MTSQFTLDRPLLYSIEVAGHFSGNFSEWLDETTVSIGSGSYGFTVTTLTGTYDQAKLMGLIRFLYYRGLPLISVNLKED